MNGWYSELTKEKGPNETNKTIQNNVTWEEKFMKKKILSILMASMMVFGLVACGGNPAKTDGAGDILSRSELLTMIQMSPDIVQQMTRI